MLVPWANYLNFSLPLPRVFDFLEYPSPLIEEYFRYDTRELVKPLISPAIYLSLSRNDHVACSLRPCEATCGQTLLSIGLPWICQLIRRIHVMILCFRHKDVCRKSPGTGSPFTRMPKLIFPLRKWNSLPFLKNPLPDLNVPLIHCSFSEYPLWK